MFRKMNSHPEIHTILAQFLLLMFISQAHSSGMVEIVFLSPETVLISSTICTRFRCNSISLDARKIKLNANVSLRLQEAPYEEAPKYYDIHLEIFDTDGESIASVFNTPESDVAWKTGKIVTTKGFNVSYKYRIMCNSSYYGARCNKFCQDSKELHTECSSSGDRRCIQGWTGPFCMTPICEYSCNGRGKCVAPGKCQCMAGYTGSSCETCLPKKGCVHGGCAGNVSFTCECKKGYGGALCTHDLEMCHRERPCHNGGKCSNIGINGYKCECPEGFVGKQCEIPVDSVRCKHQMAEDVCLNDGICISLDDKSMQCKCRPGFSGKFCEISTFENVDRCSYFQCRNGGVCEIGSDMKPKCKCDTCYKGDRCEILDAGCLVRQVNYTLHASNSRKMADLPQQEGISYECFIVIVVGLMLIAAICVFAFLTRIRTKKHLLPNQNTAESESSKTIFKVCSSDDYLQNSRITASPPPAYYPPISKSHCNSERKMYYQTVPTNNNLSSIAENLPLENCNVKR